jgi:hypothetical protein
MGGGAGNTVSATNCTYWGNNGGTGGGAIAAGAAGSSLTVSNSILWDDLPAELSYTSGSPSLSYSDIEGITPNPTLGLINQNPGYYVVHSEQVASVWFDSSAGLSSLGLIDIADSSAVVGQYLRVQNSSGVWFSYAIVGGAGTEVQVLGDVSGSVGAGDNYQIMNLRPGISYGGGCIDSGNATGAPELDASGMLRYNFPSYGSTTSNVVDMGAYEAI